MGERKRKSFSFRGEKATTAKEPRLESPEQEIGRMLSQRRLSLGYDLADIAAHLCIRQAYLAAIELGQFNQLPGATYVNGFLRTYAAFLGFDAPAVVQQYQQALTDGPPRTELYGLRPVPEGRRPGGMVLLIALLLAAVIYAGWYWAMTKQHAEQALMVPPLPDRLAAHLPRTNPPPPATPAPTTTTLTEPASAPPAPAAPQAPPATAANKPAPSSPPAEAAAKPSRVSLRALGDIWIQVRDGKGTLLKTSILHTGEHYAVPNVPGVTIFTGDAGGLALEVDGNPVPPLGKQGQVMRDVSLEPEKLLARP